MLIVERTSDGDAARDGQQLQQRGLSWLKLVIVSYYISRIYSSVHLLPRNETAGAAQRPFEPPYDREHCNGYTDSSCVYWYVNITVSTQRNSIGNL